MLKVLEWNPIGWMHAVVAGGQARIVRVASIYSFIGLALIMFSYYVTSSSDTGRHFSTQRLISELASNTLVAINFVQSILLLIALSAGTRRGIQKDFQTGMIDSHRMMPIRGWSAMVGFIIGPNATILTIAAINVVAGVACTIISGGEIAGFVGACVIMLIIGANSAMITGSMAMLFRGEAGVQVLLFMMIGLASFILSSYLPALSVLLPVDAIGRATTGSATNVTTDIAISVFIGLASMTCIGIIFMLAGIRRFRSAEVPAFNVRLGIVLLAIIALITVVGINRKADQWGTPASASGLAMTLVDDSPSTYPLARCASMSMLALIALIPIVTASRERARWQNRTAIDPTFHDPVPVSGMTTVGIITVVVAIAFSLLNSRASNWSFTAGAETKGILINGMHAVGIATLALALIPISAIVSHFSATNSKLTMPITLWIGVVWVGPIVLPGIAEAIEAGDVTTRMLIEFSPSPILGWISQHARGSAAGADPAHYGIEHLTVSAFLAGIVILITDAMRRRRPPPARVVFTNADMPTA